MASGVSSRKLICWGVVGGIMASIGIILIPVTEVVIVKFMEQEVILVPEALAYPLWQEVPLPIFFQFWFWNLTNPEEFLNGGPARLVERGPYTYREYRPKTNITHYDNGTVSYMNLKSFIFDEENSIGPETETFTNINAPAFVVAHLLRNAPDVFQRAWELIHLLSQAELVLTLTVKEFVSGYPDKYLELAQRVLGEDVIPTTIFGILVTLNNTDDGVWSVKTGETGLKDLNQMDLWNRERLLSYWTTDYANALNGSDGTIYYPFIKKEDELYVFSTYVCRSGFMVFQDHVQFRGIWLYHFSAPEYLYANATIHPPNIDFCTPDQTVCPPTGLLNVTECYFNAPIFLSSPHFLFGDESLFENVTGMNPQRSEHELAADIDPFSGVTFRGNLRAQVNMQIGPHDFLPGADKVREMYLPLMWLNESASLTEEYTDLYHNYVLIPQYVLLSVIVLLISVGGGILIGIGNFLLWRFWKGRKERGAMEEEGKGHLEVAEEGHDMKINDGFDANDNHDNNAYTLTDVN